MAYGDDITEGIPYVLSNPQGATNPLFPPFSSSASNGPRARKNQFPPPT